MIKSFNTGRLYSKAGQRIAYKTFDEGVLFADYDRGVSGFIRFDAALDAPLSTSDVESMKELVSDYFVLDAYDEFRYEHPSLDHVECRNELYAFAKNNTNSMEDN